MFERLWPKRFCREFVEARGHSCDLTALMAVVSGHKPCVDVWVRPTHLRAFLKAVHRYGLIAKQDVVLGVTGGNIDSDRLLLKDRLMVSVGYGYYPRQHKYGMHHVFVARFQSTLEKAFVYGWYPKVIVGNKAISRPLADAYRFGEGLGYPACCCEFFLWNNHLYRHNLILEVSKNKSRQQACYLCNPLGRDESYTYIAHVPCSFSCTATRKYASSLRDFLMKKEPELVEKIDRHLRLPYLVFYERIGKGYAFDGKVSAGELLYKSVYYIGIDDDSNPYFKRLSMANALRLEGNDVILLKNGKKKDVIKYDPLNTPREIPVLLQFVN